jgi:hypothetical protein
MLTQFSAVSDFLTFCTVTLEIEDFQYNVVTHIFKCIIRCSNPAPT